MLEVTGAAIEQPGILMFGVDRKLVPFGEGWRCVGGMGGRLPAIFTDGAGNASYAIDLTASNLPTIGIGEFGLYNFQFWYRDPLFGGAGFNLSNALQVRFCPGSRVASRRQGAPRDRPLALLLLPLADLRRGIDRLELLVAPRKAGEEPDRPQLGEPPTQVSRLRWVSLEEHLDVQVGARLQSGHQLLEETIEGPVWFPGSRL